MTPETVEMVVWVSVTFVGIFVIVNAVADNLAKRIVGKMLGANKGEKR